jgi:hypothetical protein
MSSSNVPVATISAAAVAVISIAGTGVPWGLTLAAVATNSPSRAIAKRIRVASISTAFTTLKSETSDSALTKAPPRPPKTAWATSAAGNADAPSPATPSAWRNPAFTRA